MPRPTARAPGGRPRRCATTAASASRELVDRVVVVAALRQRLGAGEDRLGPRALVARDAAREERRVDAEPRGEPLDRLARRLRLAALDLRDVLLREPVAREVALRQPRRDAQLAEALAEPRSARDCWSCACGAGCFIVCATACSTPCRKCQSPIGRSGARSAWLSRWRGEAGVRNYFTRLLDRAGHALLQ